MQRRSFSCQRGWRSGGSNLSIDTETICILILFQCARIHNNTGQLFKCVCIEKSTGRCTVSLQEKRGFVRGDEFATGNEAHAAAKDLYLGQDLGLWQLWRKTGGLESRGRRRMRESKGREGHRWRRREDASASSAFCSSHVGVKELM